MKNKANVTLSITKLTLLEKTAIVTQRNIGKKRENKTIKAIRQIVKIKGIKRSKSRRDLLTTNVGIPVVFLIV